MKFEVLRYLIVTLAILSTNEVIERVNNEFEELESGVDVPQNFTWGNVNGTNYLTLIRNQRIPQYCEGGWSFGATSALSDRIKIKRRAQWPDINLSPQVVLSCDSSSDGCHGGSSLGAYAYIKENNISDETCSNYQGWGRENGIPCSQDIICSTCWNDGQCGIVSDYYVYSISDYGQLIGELEMIKQIYSSGPISCKVQSESLNNYSTGIINASMNGLVDHEVSVVGWGVEGSVKYWIVRNSWGETWGEAGFFRIVRGQNQIGIESNCSFAQPIDTWSQDVMHHLNQTNKLEQQRGCQVVWSQEMDGVIRNAQPFEYLQQEDIPENWDWRNVSNVNYCGWNKNQHNPVYCGACWAEAATSALADRFNILLGRQDIALSVQAMINCQAGGSCSGGNPFGVYQYAYNLGIPTETCQSYIAMSTTNQNCTEKQVCSECTKPPPQRAEGIGAGNCFAIQNYTRYYVSEYGVVFGKSKMKAEIYARGPISCGIDATPELKKHMGWGIYSQPDAIQINHIISVVGWGQQNGTEYWIVRNSWGTFWGYYGFFRLNMDVGNLAVDWACSWGVPSLSPNQ